MRFLLLVGACVILVSSPAWACRGTAEYPALKAQLAKADLPAAEKAIYEKKLEESATIHCNSMISEDFFDHINPKSKVLKTPNDRARFVGISNPFLAENIIETFVLQYTAGDPVYPGPKGVFRYKPDGEPIPPHTYLSLGEALIDAWMNSPHHRDNILSKKAIQLGCGTAFYRNKDFNDMPTVMATQNFQLYEKVRSKP